MLDTQNERSTDDHYKSTIEKEEDRTSTKKLRTDIDSGMEKRNVGVTVEKMKKI